MTTHGRASVIAKARRETNVCGPWRVIARYHLIAQDTTGIVKGSMVATPPEQTSRNMFPVAVGRFRITLSVHLGPCPEHAYAMKAWFMKHACCITLIGLYKMKVTREP